MAETIDTARLVLLAEALVAAEHAYDAAPRDPAPDEGRRLRDALIAADDRLDEAMGSGIDLARAVLALAGKGNGPALPLWPEDASSVAVEDNLVPDGAE